MLRLLKITCISAICFIMLSGCSVRQEKIERTETNQLEQSKIEKKASESNEEEILDLSNEFNGVNGCAVLYSPSKNKYSFYNKNSIDFSVSFYNYHEPSIYPCL